MGFFFGRERKNIPLEQFPGLFEMQAHLGGSGVLFSGIWFYYAWRNIPHLYETASFVGWCAFLIPAVFFFLAWTSFTGSLYVIRQLSALHSPDAENPDAARTYLDQQVRRGMFLYSAAYVVICSVLIWLTGGAISPFVPFYVMIFTLTITKIRILNGIGWGVLGAYLLAIVLACIAAELGFSKIADDAVRLSGFQIIMHIVFIGLSLIVPTISQLRVEQIEEKAKQRVQKSSDLGKDQDDRH